MKKVILIILATFIVTFCSCSSDSNGGENYALTISTTEMGLLLPCHRANVTGAERHGVTEAELINSLI